MNKINKILIFFIFILLWQCSLLNKKEEKDKTPEQAALFFLLQEKTCTIDKEIFIIKEGNISCSGSTIEGTGLLLSTEEKKAPSIEATITLKGDDSEFIFYGASDSDLRKNGSGFRFAKDTAKAFHPDGTLGGVDMPNGFKPSTNIEKTFCLEIHSGETPPHLVGWQNNCPSPTNNNPDYNSENSGSNPGGSSAKKGTKWGIEVKNAKVNLKINSEEIFGH